MKTCRDNSALEGSSQDLSGRLIGSSPTMAAVRERIELAAPYDEPVLIVGETGTGKELVARSIHEHSRRRLRQFHIVNCGAVQEDLLVSELFGHRAGAFTGATRSRQGRIGAASASTLFLDEVSETTARFQVALLRAIDHGEIQPVGAEGPPEQVDVRFIAATNRDFLRLQQEEEFRQDLLYRLSCFVIDVPPPRRRREDIPELAEFFVGGFSEKYGRHWYLSGAAVALLCEHDFPGNVRELRQVVFSACAESSSDRVAGLDVCRVLSRRRPQEHASRCPGESHHLALKPLLREHLRRVILAAEGNLSGAAELLEVPRSTLQHMVARHGIDLARLRETATSMGERA